MHARADDHVNQVTSLADRYSAPILLIDTEVHTGRGDSTRIGAESPHLEEWITRGH